MQEVTGFIWEIVRIELLSSMFIIVIVKCVLFYSISSVIIIFIVINISIINIKDVIIVTMVIIELVKLVINLYMHDDWVALSGME